MLAEIITTGEEVLSGQITDTNAVYLAQVLIASGFEIGRRSTVGDRLDALVALFRERSQHADVIVVNGGLGPTSDDLSAQAAAQAVGVPQVEYVEWSQFLRERFARMKREMPDSNLKQAMLPEGSLLLDNPNGSACGFALKLNRAWFYFTPGPPKELKPMVQNSILPHIRQTFELRNGTIVKKLLTFGLGEARVGEMMADIPLPEGVSLGYRAFFPMLEVKVMAHGPDPAALEVQAECVAQMVRERLADNLLFEGEQSMAEYLRDRMIAKGASLTLAESCTGGMIAAQLIDAPDSSRYIQRGIVSYSNQAKTELLGVPSELLEAKGAVSIEVAVAMAEGARTRAGADYALAVSGIAGPGGGTEAKPVGTVAIAMAAPQAVFAQVVQIPATWGRSTIRQGSAMAALDMLRRELDGKPVFGVFDFAKASQTLVQERVAPV